jgi:hypothetical protein
MEAARQLNAIEARELRQESKRKSLSMRLREDGEMARRIETYPDELRLEQGLIDTS